MRIIGVCKTVAQLKAALQKLGETFKGCGRVKVRAAAALNCARAILVLVAQAPFPLRSNAVC